MIELDDSLVSGVKNLRRWFHQHPEPSFEERKTQDRIVEVLNGLGIENRRAGETGVIADIRGNGTGRTIALRSDMDALRIQEAETELNGEYRSQNAGVMHACGHDGHMAMLLGAARWLQEHWDKLAGNVRLIFQPAEEVPPGGAVSMIADGCLDGVDAIIAAHIFGNMPLSRIGFRPGPFMASSRTFKVSIKGKPGHHMCPQENIDPIQIAARFISTIQTDIRQRLNPNARYVLGFGEVHSGMQHNQTPAEAEVVGTFRAYDLRDSETIAGAIKSNLDGLMLSFGSSLTPHPSSPVPSYTLDAEPAYPPLVNNPAFTKRASEVLKRSFPDVDDDMEPNLGAEDFACYLDKVPGMFLFLGGANPERGITAMNHSDRFDMDEAVLATGTKALVTLATDFLRDPASYLSR
ncbi:amidohydrolase [candidate division WOR-3 bacterium]|uniref:Amidohydrolase n=1 Tax=candidate division WOR-3 bacterium TaxID=2052148 RepID=A0A937XCM2_UNCW3|nr:amidohydrolase [candidate division WOR-3 bacterium]